MLGKSFSRRHIEIVFLYFQENRIWHFMQIVSWRQFAWNVKACFLKERKSAMNLSSAEFVHRVVNVKQTDHRQNEEMTDLIIVLHTKLVNINSEGANVKYLDALRIKLFRFAGLIQAAPSLILKRRQGIMSCTPDKQTFYHFACWVKFQQTICWNIFHIFPM